MKTEKQIVTRKEAENPGVPPAVSYGFQTWFLEFDHLLVRIERGTTHYQILGLERTASLDEVVKSYQQAIGQLFPPYQISGILPADLQQRVRQSFEKTSEAFYTLADFKLRKEYDQHLVTEKIVTASRPSLSVVEKVTPVLLMNKPALSAPEEPLEVCLTLAQREFATEPVEEGQERRCGERYKIKLPVQLTGYDRNQRKWEEQTETIDVSRTGISFYLSRRVWHNKVVEVALPLPDKLRAFDQAQPHYQLFAVIRRIFPGMDGRYSVAVEFLGKEPPPGFAERPWAECRTLPRIAVNRRFPRHSLTRHIELEFLTGDKEVLASEPGVTENISRGGMMIRLKALPDDFDLVRLIALQSDFESLALVVNRFTGADGMPRVCLQFIEREWEV